MPITKSAIKALRQDRKRERVNRPVKTQAKSAVALARQNPTAETLQKAFSALDKAVKKHVLKKSKVNRLKSRLTKLLGKTHTRVQTKSPRTTKSQKAATKRKVKTQA